MFKIFKRLNSLFLYCRGAIITLKNWPSYLTDLIRTRLGLKSKCNFYKLRDGTKINIHPNSRGLNYVFYSVYIKGEYNRLENFKIGNNDLVIDIGAHLGFFTIKSAKKAKNGTVYAFEPFSKHYKLLKQNIEQNSIKNVKYFNTAITDKKGELSFYYTMDGDPGDTSLFNLKPDQKTYEEKINAISLNDFFEEEKLDVCNFLKLDCEGAEYSILMNASDSTLNKIQRIAMEWHRFSAEQDPKSLVDFLKNKGFKIKEISPLNKITGFLFAYR